MSWSRLRTALHPRAFRYVDGAARLDSRAVPRVSWRMRRSLLESQTEQVLARYLLTRR